MSEELINAVVELRDNDVFDLIKKQLNNRNAMEIFNDLREGIIRVGDLFEKDEYFLTELIFAGDLFNEAAELLIPYFPKNNDNIKEKVVIGTIEGDFHDIGKNIMITLLKSNGYDVIDLGVDVSCEKFVDTIKNNEPHILGISGLLTSSAEPMRQAINLIKKECKKIPMIIVGGNKVNDDWVEYVGADYGTTNAVTGLKIISEAMNLSKE